MSFQEKVRLFSEDYLKYCLYIADLPDHIQSFPKKLYSSFIVSSQLLEDFLDFHGAKNNKEWFYYRELTASIRHLSLGSYSQKHICNRLVFYELDNVDTFRQKGIETLWFLTQSLIKLAPAIVAEARRLQIDIPQCTFTPAEFPDISTKDILPCDIDDEDRDEQKKSIVRIASDFLTIADTFDQIGFYQPCAPDALTTLVPAKINEVETRRFEMVVHNLQSSFDTYVIHGGYRYGNRKLKQLRSHFSVVFHLLQLNGRLLHFYERHLEEAGYKSIYKQVHHHLCDLVDPQRLLDYTINYGLFYICYFLNSGKKLAQDILNDNIERSAVTVGIPVKLGFHSRPSLLVAKIVQHYGGQVELVVGQDRFDASSVLDIQWAGGKIHKEQISEVVFEGDVRALADIETLANVNYGEDTMGKGVPLPKALSYLR